MKLESRRQLYYGKYKYRAKLHLLGLSRTYYSKTFLDFLKKIEKALTDHSNDSWTWGTRLAGDIQNIDLDCIERYIDWRNKYQAINKPAIFLLRIESNTAGIYSNDLSLLKTLESIPNDPDSIVYTQTDDNIPAGVLQFCKQPKRKFRVYLKGHQVSDSFRADVLSFITRYEGTSSEVYPCGALLYWLTSPKIHTWHARHCNSCYFLEFNNDSTLTILSLMFDKMIGKHFILEKRPT